MKKILVLGSGGLDSTVLLHRAMREVGKENVHLLSMSYGQKHSVELNMLFWHARKHDIPRDVMDLSVIFSFNRNSSALLSGSEQKIDHRSYADQLQDTEVVSAYVPYRNGLFLSAAASVAYQLGCDTIAYGAHADDAVRRQNGTGSAAYPDCTPAFIEAQAKAIYEGTDGRVALWTPFINMDKTRVVGEGIACGMTREDFEHTHSCYEGIEGGCGTCGTCRDRNAALDAFVSTKGVGQTGVPRQFS